MAAEELCPAAALEVVAQYSADVIGGRVFAADSFGEVAAFAVFVAAFDYVFAIEAGQPLAGFVRAGACLAVFAVLPLEGWIVDFIIE